MRKALGDRWMMDWSILRCLDRLIDCFLKFPYAVLPLSKKTIALHIVVSRCVSRVGNLSHLGPWP